MLRSLNERTKGWRDEIGTVCCTNYERSEDSTTSWFILLIQKVCSRRALCSKSECDIGEAEDERGKWCYEDRQFP